MAFNPVFISATTLDDAWFQLLWNIEKHGRKYLITKGSYEGQHRLAFDYVAGFISMPHERPLAPRLPEWSSLPPPTTDEEIDNYFANYLMNSNLEPNEHYRYSTWIVGGDLEQKIDGYRQMMWRIVVPNQIEWIIKHFKEAGYGNEHCYLQVGYPESNFVYDYKGYKTEADRLTSPCLRGLDFRIIDNQLTTHVIYRSWDLLSGWPTNMGGFTLLNEYVAQEVGVEPGPLSFSSKSLHIYEHGLQYLEERLGL